MSQVSKETLLNVEADCFWCLGKLLDGIQVTIVIWLVQKNAMDLYLKSKDNYTHGQPGIQRQIIRLKELINRIDGGISKFWH